MPQLTPEQKRSYLDKIGFAGNPLVDLPSLRELVEKHIQTFPFETINLHDSTLDNVPSRDSDIAFENIFNRCINHNRGGNCVSLNILLQEVLENFGFSVIPIVADTLWNSNEPIGERSKHCALIVTIAGEHYLVDAGFGSVGLLSLIPLKEGVYNQFSEQFRMQPSEEYEFECQVWGHNKWQSIYGFNNQKASLEDYARINQLQTNPRHPECSFGELMLCTKPFKTEHGNGRIRICNSRLLVYENDVIVEDKRFYTQKKLWELLAKHFNINLQKHHIRFTNKAQTAFLQNEQPKLIVPQYTQTRRIKYTAIKVPPSNNNSLSNLAAKMKIKPD